MSDESLRFEFTLERSIEAKSRPAPILVREDDKFTVGTFADPTEALGEAYIRARARAAKREWENAAGRTWPMNEKYAVYVLFGATIAGESTDVDNLAKTILDGMSKAVFNNDNRVEALHVERQTEKRFKVPQTDFLSRPQPRFDGTKVRVEVVG